MGLIGNMFRNSTGVHRAFGDLPAYQVPRQYSDWSYVRSQVGATAVIAGMAFPQGAYADAWFPPQVAGEMALRGEASSTLAGNLVPTRAMTLDLTGAGDLDATAGLAVAMALALTGAGSITATIQGWLNASATLTGSGSMTATMEGLGNMVIDLLGSGDLDATVAAYGDMAIDIVMTGSGLTTSNVGQAVWAALAADNNIAGTMGDLLNAAGGGGISGAVIDQIADAVWEWIGTELAGSKGEELAKALKAAKLAAALSA